MLKSRRHRLVNNVLAMEIVAFQIQVRLKENSRLQQR